MLIAGDACFLWQQDSEMCDSREYLVSAAWITSGILTIIQVFRAKIIGTGYYLGTGLISVMGTSFTFLPIAREMVIRAITDAQAEGKCDCTPGTDAETGAATCGYPFDCKGYGKEGYGKFLGTAMVAAFLEVVIALMPAKLRQKLFPPVVTGMLLCAEAKISRRAPPDSPVDFHTGAAPSTTRARTRTGRRRSSS
jgi:NCS2 family nucleobase:cation symporter-2